MPRATPLINNFNGGELSPLIDARSDINKYYTGCRVLENMFPFVEGGARRIPGTYYVVSTKSNGPARLIPFTHSSDQVYILEFGHLYIRVFKDNGQIWAGASEGADLVTNGAFPANITGWTSWSFGNGAILWDAGGKMKLYQTAPYMAGYGAAYQMVVTEVGATYTLRFDVSNAPLKVSVGTASGLGNLAAEQTYSVGADHSVNFVATTVSSYIRVRTPSSTTDNHYIDNITCKKQVTPTAVEIITTYTETELRELKFRQTTDTLYIAHPNHPTATLTRTSHTSWSLMSIQFDPPPSFEADTDISAGTITLTPDAVTGADIIFTASAPCFLAADVGRIIKFGAARASIITYTSTTVVRADIIVDFPDLNPIPAASWLLSGSPSSTLNPGQTKVGVTCNFVSSTPSATFRTEDVGKYIKIHGGVALITAFTNNYTVRGKILTELSATTGTTYWSLEVASWTASYGYPGAIHFYDGCLWLGGTVTQPTTLWKSKSAEYENFAEGTLASDAVTLVLDSGKMDRVLSISGDDALVIGTASGIWRPRDSADAEPISATNPPSLRKRINNGIKNIDPVTTSDSLMWISRSAREVLRMTYSIDQDRHIAQDVTRLARHIAVGLDESSSGIIEIAWQQEPIPILWCVRADGQLLGMVFSPMEEVIGWFRVALDGVVESVAVIAEEDVENQVWLIVNRVIKGALFNGGPQLLRSIEYIMPHEIYGLIENAFFVQCGLTYNAGNELIVNGDMEGDSSWSSAGVPEINARSATRKVSGDYSRRCVDSTPSYGGIFQLVTVVPGETYRLTFKIYLDRTTYTAGSVIAGLWDATHSLWLGAAQTITTDGEWLTFTIEATATAGCVLAGIYAYNTDTAGGDAVEFYLDDVSMKRVVNTISNLGHLEGETVQVLGDGKILDEEFVLAGSITLSAYANKVHVGLPITSIIESMKLHAGSQAGSARGKKQKINSMTTIFHETGYGVKIGPDASDMRIAPELIDGELTTDDATRIFPGDWGDKATIRITQDQPVPMTVLGVVPRVSLYED